ncbi:DUF4232 domain-containing protein [Streptomyces yaanensis]|uniref:DUF4232 domain-containing protein n=1 Tax=Streptomyces yaanensis TaxID=1142239 RepID=A0ABV7SCE1_9ACTN|nr:DUF4232 domain-containing protein [Streptomyces sp. CGMCC 4.7035]WNB96898.1 DUF4232 domain-containing protein [Streptomyces sp. CGMCC 4.7035]
MRTLPVPLAVTALAAALALTACDSGGSSGGDSDKAAGCSIGIKVGPGNAATTAGDTGNVPVTLTNRDTKKCTFEGFPGIELNGGDSSWTVAHAADAHPEKVTLQKEETATFTITYVRGKSGASDSAAVKTLKITVPGGGDAQSFPWSFGDVSLKKPDTPDASVTPIQIAGD